MYEVERSFCAEAAFSEVNLKIKRLSSAARGRRVSTLIFRKFDLTAKVDSKLTQMFKDRRTFNFTSKQPLLERNVLIEIARSLLLPLFGNVTFEIDYRKHVKVDLEGAAHIGLGSPVTWNGTADLRVYGDWHIITTAGVDDESEDEEEREEEVSEVVEEKESVVIEGASPSSSSHSGVYYDGKQLLKRKHVPQAVATCLTHAFTQNGF